MSLHIKNSFRLSSVLGIGLMLISGCNTTETGFYIGDVNDIKLSYNLESPQIKLEADGASKDIEVLSNVKWEIIPPELPFTAEASSTEGNGIIEVSAINNFNTSTTPESKLIVRAVEFPEKQFEIKLIQNQLVFQMDKQDYPVSKEEGGTVNLRFKSSINWKIKILSGESGWIIFNPDTIGSGSWDEITVHANWMPNYNTEAREMRLRLIPADSNWLQSGVAAQDTIILRQDAGTLPKSIQLSDLGAEKNSVFLSLHYESNAPVEKVELKVAKATSLDEAFIFTVPYPDGMGNYPNIADFTFTLGNLEAGIPYNLTPIVTSKVGTKEGNNPIRIQTRGDIEFDYPHLDRESSYINPEVTGVNAYFKTISEVELKTFKVSLCQMDGTVLATQNGKITPVLDETNNPVSWIGELTWDNSIKLSQKTEYYFDPIVTGVNPNQPDTQNIFEHKLGFENFTTLFRQPEQGDNKPIQ